MHTHIHTYFQIQTDDDKKQMGKVNLYKYYVLRCVWHGMEAMRKRKRKDMVSRKKFILHVVAPVQYISRGNKNILDENNWKNMKIKQVNEYKMGSSRKVSRIKQLLWPKKNIFTSCRVGRYKYYT